MPFSSKVAPKIAQTYGRTPENTFFKTHQRAPTEILGTTPPYRHPTDTLHTSGSQPIKQPELKGSWNKIEPRRRTCIFKILYILHLFSCIPIPHPILVVLTGGWKGEGPDETFGDKLLVGHSQTFISYKESMEILRRWHLHFSISQRNMEIYVVGVCKI